VEFRVAFGKAGEEILEEARETNADLIVMGAKTRKTFAGRVPLTIAYNVEQGEVSGSYNSRLNQRKEACDAS
jgi:nucleotide-binding universal stress UspA family protein